MAQTELTAEDMFKSLTGFEEIAVSRAFGEDLSKLRERPFTFMRALVFADQRRHGLNDHDAREHALGMTLGQVEEYFPDDEPEIVPDEPVTEMGKGDSPSE